MVDKEKRKMIIKGFAGAIGGIVGLAMLKSAAADFVFRTSGKEHVIGANMYVDGSLNANGDVIAGGALSVGTTLDVTGAATFTKVPTGTGVAQGSLYINPASATANYTLLGLAVNGSEKFKVDAEGDVIVGGALSVDHIKEKTAAHGIHLDNALTVSTINNYVFNGCEVYIDSYGVPVYIKQNHGIISFFEFCGDDTTVWSTSINCCKLVTDYNLGGSLKVLVDGNIKWIKYFSKTV